MFSLLLFLIFFVFFLKISLHGLLARILYTLLEGTQTTFIQGGSTLMSNPQPFHINLLFILYHFIIFLFYFIIYNRKGNTFVHLLLKNSTPFTYMYLIVLHNPLMFF